MAIKPQSFGLAIQSLALCWQDGFDTISAAEFFFACAVYRRWFWALRVTIADTIVWPCLDDISSTDCVVQTMAELFPIRPHGVAVALPVLPKAVCNMETPQLDPQHFVYL